MATTQLNAVLQHVRETTANRKVDDSSDSQLLAEFAAQETEAAFAAILKRHGAMVLRVCRRVLQHEQDAEDAFQATFLVLARRAAAIRKKEAIASWLHGVAHPVAMNVKRAATRRRLHWEQAKAAPRSAPERDLAWREVQAVLDEEIRRLPESIGPCLFSATWKGSAARRTGICPGG